MKKRQLTFAAVTAALIVGAGLLWPVPSHAGSYYGPTRNAQGQCWHSSYGVGIAGIGWWGECERSASSLFGQPPGRGPFPGANGQPGHTSAGSAGSGQ